MRLCTQGDGDPKDAESTATQAPEFNSGDRGGLAESEGLATQPRRKRLCVKPKLKIISEVLKRKGITIQGSHADFYIIKTSN